MAVVTAAPIAGPFTAAPIGLLKLMNMSKRYWFLSRSCVCSFDGIIGCSSPERSTPAE